MGPDEQAPRWLTVTPKDQPQLEITLHNPVKWHGPEAGEKLLQTIGLNPIICVNTNNIQETYETLKNRGVKFAFPPKEESWGIQTVFEDLDGNKFCLVQPKQWQ